MSDIPLLTPISPNISPALLRTLSLKQLQQRPLNDAAFAGCRPEFNWRDYIHLEFTDAAFQKEVETTLDQFSLTPEGQQTIRQAYAVQNNLREKHKNERHSNAVLQPATSASPQKLKIKDIPEADADLAQSAWIDHLQELWLSRSEIEKSSYMGLDGRLYHYTLPHVLYHELSHAKDAGIEAAWTYQEITGLENMLDQRSFALAINKIDYRQDPQWRALSERFKSVVEYPAILDTNSFIEKYYAEHARALQHNSFIAVAQKTPITPIIAQPELEHGISYQQLPHLPAAPCKQR